MAEGARCLGRDEVTRVISHRQAVVAVRTVLLAQVFVIDGGVE